MKKVTNLGKEIIKGKEDEKGVRALGPLKV